MHGNDNSSLEAISALRTSMLKSARRGTVTTLASLTAASKAYMVNVGGVSTMQSPGSSTQRMSKSISSSAPQPTCRCSKALLRYSDCTCVYEVLVVFEAGTRALEVHYIFSTADMECRGTGVHSHGDTSK